MRRARRRRPRAVASFGAAPLVLILSLAACGRGRQAPPSPTTQATQSPAAPASAASSAQLFAIEPLEALSKLPVVALSRWTQVRFEEVPDIPVVTVFDDGSVVAWREHAGRKQFVEAILARGELNRVLAGVRDSGLFETPPDNHGPVRATHTPSTTIAFRVGDRWKVVAVEGYLDGTMVEGQDYHPPAPFVAMYRSLMTLPLPGAKPWKHRHVRVQALAVSETATALPWPAELPTPGPSTFPPGDERDKRYVVSDLHEKAARDALARTKDLPFALDGKRWRVVAVEPTLEAWTYLERVRYCSANPRGCRDRQ